jgi:ABC-type multidrug transport system permease subunit
MINSLFWKIVGNQVSNATSSSSGNGGMILAIFAILAIAAVVVGLLIWFYCACYGWLVLVFPAFAAFPRWAFVLLLFMFRPSSSSSSNSSSSS